MTPVITVYMVYCYIKGTSSQRYLPKCRAWWTHSFTGWPILRCVVNYAICGKTFVVGRKRTPEIATVITAIAGFVHDDQHYYLGYIYFYPLWENSSLSAFLHAKNHSHLTLICTVFYKTFDIQGRQRRWDWPADIRQGRRVSWQSEPGHLHVLWMRRIAQRGKSFQ